MLRLEEYLRPENHIIGGSVTLAAITIPDAALSYLGKFLFALATAAISSYVSALVKNRFKKP